MKKRILTTIIAAVLGLSMVACGVGGLGGPRELSNDYIIIHQYRGLEVTKVEVPEITDEDVENRIQMELGQRVVHNDITDRPARIGDRVTIDFAGSVDGELFDGGSAQGTHLHLGSGAFIGPYGNYDGFEEQIVGYNVGDNYDITIQFPSVYHAPDLAGLVAVFNITIHAITETVMPELTDEWVQENSRGSTTVAEYREEIRDLMYDGNRLGILFRQQHEVFTVLMDHVEVIEIPQWAIDEEVEMQMDLYRNIAAAEGMEFEELLHQMMGMDEEMFREQIIVFATDTATMQIAIDLIVESNNLALSEDEMYERIEELAILSDMESAQAYMDRFGEEIVRATIMHLRVAEFLIEHAQLVDEADIDLDMIPEDWDDVLEE
jgi:trigger factor